MDLPAWLTLWALQIAIYHTNGAAFLALDYSGRLRRYKTQPGGNEPPKWDLVRAASMCGVFNYVAVGFPAAIGFELIRWAIHGAGESEESSSLGGVAIQFAFFLLVQDGLHFYLHSLLHR